MMFVSECLILSNQAVCFEKKSDFLVSANTSECVSARLMYRSHFSPASGTFFSPHSGQHQSYQISRLKQSINQLSAQLSASWSQADLNVCAKNGQLSARGWVANRANHRFCQCSPVKHSPWVFQRIALFISTIITCLVAISNPFSGHHTPANCSDSRWFCFFDSSALAAIITSPFPALIGN